MSDMIVKDTVLRWCQEEGMFKDELKEPGTEFHYKINLPELPGKNPLILNIVQPKGKDKIIVTAAIGLDQGFSAAMARIGKEDREKFMLDMCYTLHLGPSHFYIEESDGIMKQVNVSDVIYTDGLTKDRLMRSIQAVYKGVSLVVLQLRGILGGTAPAKDATAPPKAEPRISLGGTQREAFKN